MKVEPITFTVIKFWSFNAFKDLWSERVLQNCENYYILRALRQIFNNMETFEKGVYK